MASVPNLTLAQCLARSNKVIRSGSATAYRDSSGSNDRTYDFRSFTVTALNGNPVLVGNGSAGTSNTFRPAVIGSVQDATLRPTLTSNNTQGSNLGWRAAYTPNGDSLFVRAEDWAIISGYRSRDADDAISIRSNGHRRTFFSIRDCLVENCYDDAVEDDSLEPGEMDNCLVDGTGVFLSQRLDASDPFSTPRTSADVFTVKNSLVRLRLMTGWDPAPSLLRNHILFKWDGNLSCRLHVESCILVVPGISAYGTDAMRWPSGTTCVNVKLLYGGGGPYPQPVPAGVTQYTTETSTTYAQALASIWDVERRNWLVNHGLQAGVPSSSVARLDVLPSSGVAPLSATLDASASTGVSGTDPYVFTSGDGTTYAAQAAATKAHTYNTAGTFTAQVTTQPGSSTATDTVVVAPVATPTPAEWRYSTSSDRSGAVPLAGAILKATRYLHLGNDAGVVSARNFVDDPAKLAAPFSTDTSSPFDLVPGASATVAFQGTATSATTGAGTADNLAVSVPASTAAGEVLVAVVCDRTGNQAPIVGPAGWTQAPSSPTYKGNSIALTVWTRTASGSEPGSYTWTTLFGGVPVATKLAGCMARFSGVDTAAPWHVASGQAEATSQTTHQTPSITTTVASCMLVEVFSDRATSTWTPPSGSSETERIDVTTTGGADVSLEFVTSTTVAAGAYQKTATASAASAFACMWLGALKPASSGTATGLDTATLADGTHEVTAELTRTDDSIVDIGAVFTVQNGAYALRASYTNDRKNSFALAGATISGVVYVFLTPDADLQQVEWWLDNPTMTGPPLHIDPGRPYDFIGGDQALGTAYPWDTSNLAGAHTISVRVTRADTTTATVATNFSIGISKFLAATSATVSSPLTSEVTIAVPGGIQAGDVLLSAVANRSGTPITIPAGWSHATASPVDYGTSLHLAIAWRPVTDPAAEPASYRWDLGGDPTTTQWAGMVIAWRGISVTSPFHAAAALSETEDLTSHVTGAVTPTEPGCWLCTVAAERLISATPSGLATTSTDVERIDLATTPPGAISLAVYDSDSGVAAGSPITRTITSGNASRYFTSWVACLRPSSQATIEWAVDFLGLGGGAPPTPPGTYASLYSATY